jgi:hypothetical protein
MFLRKPGDVESLLQVARRLWQWIGFLLLLQTTRDAIQRLWSCIVGGVVVDIVRHIASNHLISLRFRNG